MSPFIELKNKAKRVIYIIWISLTASSLSYGVVAYLEVRFRQTNSGVLSGKEEIVYWICMLLGILNIFLYRHLLSDKRIKHKLERDITPENLTEKFSNKKEKNKLRSQLLKFSQNELKLYSALSFHLNIICVCLSINNLISMMGFLLVISEGAISYMVPMLIISTVLNLYMHPRTEAYLTRVKKRLPADYPKSG